MSPLPDNPLLLARSRDGEGTRFIPSAPHSFASTYVNSPLIASTCDIALCPDCSTIRYSYLRLPLTSVSISMLVIFTVPAKMSGAVLRAVASGTLIRW